MRKVIAVLFLAALASAQTKPTANLTETAKTKVISAYRLAIIKNTELSTRQNNLCAVNEDCLAAAKKAQEASDALKKEIAEALKESSLPADSVLQVDSDKGTVTVLLPEKKAEKK